MQDMSTILHSVSMCSIWLGTPLLKIPLRKIPAYLHNSHLIRDILRVFYTIQYVLHFLPYTNTG